MIPKKIHAKIYKDTVELLNREPRSRRALVDAVVRRSGFSKEELSDISVNSSKNIYRNRVGTVISEMLDNGAIIEGKDGIYRLPHDKRVIMRIERCEREILRMLTKAPADKHEICDTLTKIFGTDKTPTKRDDGKLYDFITKTLKRLISISVITFNGNYYALSEKAAARADDINALTTLKSEFLARLHAKGGEFFENYFMNLIAKYLTKNGKTVTECSTTGGSDDGGIDGIIKTRDTLGFRETIMVQTKNRNSITKETDIRGFYGAVCANRGTRGIYATTYTFHSAAEVFLDGIDECIGIDGERIFSMACECLYGIAKQSGKLIIDKKII